MQRVSEMVRQVVQERRLTQVEIAKVIGVKQSTVSKKLAGDYPWTDKELDKLIERYNIQVRFLNGARYSSTTTTEEHAIMKFGREDLSPFERELMLKLLDCLRSSLGQGRATIILNIEALWESLPKIERSKFE